MRLINYLLIDNFYSLPVVYTTSSFFDNFSVFLESDFEYSITASVGTAKLVYPLTAPAVCQTVVIRP